MARINNMEIKFKQSNNDQQRNTSQSPQKNYQTNHNDQTEEPRQHNGQSRYRGSGRNNFGFNRNMNVQLNRTVPYDECASCGQKGHWRHDSYAPIMEQEH